MAQKTPERAIAEAEEVAWYKWEFLRRNREYRKEQDAFVSREFGDWFREHGYWYDQSVLWTPEDWEYFATVIAPRARTICVRWHVMDPSPPDWEFDSCGVYEYKPNYPASLPTAYSLNAIRAFWEGIERLAHENLADLVRRAPATTADGDRYRYLRLRLDLTRPHQELINEAKREIVARKKHYEKWHPPTNTRSPTTRRRLDRYRDYLKVWDLRMQGEKFEAIGADVFPQKRSHGKVFSEKARAQRAWNSFQKAQVLIRGGYKELR